VEVLEAENLDLMRYHGMTPRTLQSEVINKK